MTTALQAPRVTDAKSFFLASAPWGSVHLHYSGGPIGPWKRHTQT